VRFQDLSFVLPQNVDLGLLPVTAAFRAACDLTERFVLVLESGNAEGWSYWSLECCAGLGHPLHTTLFRNGARANRGYWSRTDGPDHGRGTETEHFREIESQTG
jgi:hypothetical protein